MAWAAKQIIHAKQVQDIAAAAIRRPQVDHHGDFREVKVSNLYLINFHSARLASSIDSTRNCC